MPYYFEVDYSANHDSTFVSNGGPQTSARPVTSTTLQQGYRSRGPRGKLSTELTELECDPYAGFLTELMRTRAGNRVFVRDTGHTYSKTTQSFYQNNQPVVVRAGTGQILVSKAANYAATWAAGDVPYSLGNTLDSPFASSNLAAFGQQAISKVAPAPYVFEMSQFLGELREGLPSLVGAALIKGRVRDIMKNAGSEYLNAQFGWLPLVSDLQKLVKTVVNLDTLLNNRRGEQGEPKRARFKTPKAYMSTTTNLDRVPITLSGNGHFAGSNATARSWRIQTERARSVFDGLLSTGFPYRPDLNTADTRLNGTAVLSASREQWFEGSFTSFFDYPPVSADWLTKAKALMNLGLTPQVLWELAPWSWLVDWVFHIQSSIESNSRLGNKQVVMNYGYVMEKESVAHLVNGSQVGRYSTYTVEGGTVAQLSNASWFRRLRANPFGFQATSFSGFNPEQLAILVSLGLSRG